MASPIKTLNVDLQTDIEGPGSISLSKGALYFQFAYSLIGLLTAVACFAIGLYLFVAGLNGSSTILVKASGYELSITNAAPGTVMLLAGVAISWVTKYNVVIHQK